MKYVNADYGIDSVRSDGKRPWYQWPRFPLVPQFSYRPADEWNTADFTLSWLNLRVWSMMDWSTGIALHIEDTGILLGIRLPYLNIKVWLMLFPLWLEQKGWRIPKYRNEDPPQSPR